MAGDNRERVALIPNAMETLYSEEDMIHGKSEEYRPHNNFLKFLGGGIKAGIKENVLSSIPDFRMGVGAYIDSAKHGYISKNNALRHANFRQAFKNNVPVLNKVVQNFYSLYATSWGLTNSDITAILTIDGGDGKEELHGFEYKGAIRSPDEMRDKMLNKEAINAGVIAELMNEEIETKGIRDIKDFIPLYANSEPFLYGAKGKRSLVNDKDGKKVFRYERPSRGELFKYYLKNDLTYTILDTAIGLVVPLTELAKQGFYEDEVAKVIIGTQGGYGDRNIGGAPNPFAAGYRKAA
ncbi:MAG: hypothetical protein V1813_04065 [Candidatus Aenigmatarchaeota archaeon]